MSVKTGVLALDQEPTDINSQLERRHRAASRTVLGLVVAVLLLSIVAFLSRNYLVPKNNQPLDMAIRIVLLMFGLGSIVWRRTKFAGMRLKDIGALQGATGLLSVLEKTTLQLALLGAAIAAIGFVGTLLMGNEFYTYTAAGIALVVLLYSYPSKSSWTRTIERYS